MCLSKGWGESYRIWQCLGPGVRRKRGGYGAGVTAHESCRAHADVHASASGAPRGNAAVHFTPRLVPDLMGRSGRGSTVSIESSVGVSSDRVHIVHVYDLVLGFFYFGAWHPVPRGAGVCPLCIHRHCRGPRACRPCVPSSRGGAGGRGGGQTLDAVFSVDGRSLLDFITVPRLQFSFQTERRLWYH